MEDKLKLVIGQVEKVLIEKNKRYGNAALKPINVFYKGDATNSICIRLDDKISRIINSDILRKNDLFDLLGYLYLYCISLDNNKECSFIDSVTDISSNLLNFIEHVFVTKDKITKEVILDRFNDIKKLTTNSTVSEYTLLVSYLMSNIVVYFIENDILDFTELID